MQLQWSYPALRYPLEYCPAIIQLISSDTYVGMKFADSKFLPLESIPSMLKCTRFNIDPLKVTTSRTQR